jgi:hypothetical protein
MDAEGGTGEVSRRACISGTDGSACCLPDVLAGNVVLKGLRLINRAYREDIVISSASPIHSEGMGGVIDGTSGPERAKKLTEIIRQNTDFAGIQIPLGCYNKL